MRTAVRNREIFAAYQNCELIEVLARRYGLSVLTIREIIRIEKHKVAVSVDGFYEKIRLQKLRMPQEDASDTTPARRQAEAEFTKAESKEPRP